MVQALTVLGSLTRCEARWSEEKDELVVLMKVNSAACHHELREHISVLELCNDVLQQQNNHPKALYRRAAAHQAREEWTEAAKDFAHLLDADAAMDQQSRDKVQRRLAVIEAQQRRVQQRNRDKYDGFLLRAQQEDTATSSSASLLYADRIDEQEQLAKQSTLLGQLQQRLLALPASATTAFHWLWAQADQAWRRCRRPPPTCSKAE